MRKFILVSILFLLIPCSLSFALSIGGFKVNPLNPLKPVEYKGQGLAEAFLTSQGAPTPANLNAVADRFNQNLDAKLQERQKLLMADIDKRTSDFLVSVDAQKNTLLQGLDEIARDSLIDLDTTLQAAIEKTNESLERQNGILDTTLLKHRALFERSLLVLAAIVALFALTAILLAAAIRHSVGKDSQHRRIRWVVAALALAASLGAVFCQEYMVGRPKVVASLEKELSEKYIAALNEGAMKEAAFFSTQLSSLDRSNPRYRFDLLKSELIRDLFERPTVYKTESGYRELDRRVRSLNAASAKAGVDFDSDTAAAEALIRWQLGTSRIDEAYAAMLASQSLSKPGNVRGLNDLVAGYLKAYLAFPISDQDAELLQLKKYIPGGLWPSEESLAGALRTYEANPVRSNEEDRPFINYYNYSKMLSDLYVLSVPMYVDAVYYNALAAVATGESQQKLISRRNSSATQVVEHWSRAAKDLRDSSYDNTSARIASLRSLMALSTRAKQLVALGSQSGVPDAAVPKGDTIFLDEMLASIRPGMRQLSYGYVKLAASDRFKEQLKALNSFETQLSALIATRISAETGGWDAARIGAGINQAQVVAETGASLGLFYCSRKETLDDRRLLSDYIDFSCADDQAAPKNSIVKLASQLLGEETRPAANQWAKIYMKGIDIRTVPAL